MSNASKLQLARFADAEQEAIAKSFIQMELKYDPKEMLKQLLGVEESVVS